MENISRISNRTALCLYACLAVWPGDAHANIDNAGLLDNVLARYATVAGTWASTITSHATWLFWTLATISLVWTFAFMAMRKADLGEFFAEFISFTIFTGFFWWLLINGPNFANSIMNSMRQIAGTASGIGPNISPSGIVDIGFGIYMNVSEKSSIWHPVDFAVGIIISAVILVVLALVGVNMLLLLISGWILAYAGVFFLGFGGSRWTSDMATGYFRTVLNIGAQLFTMVLIVGIGKSFLDSYYANMNNGILLGELGVMLVVSVVLLAMVNKLPPLVGALAMGGGAGALGSGYGAGAAAATAVMGAAAVATAGAALVAGAASVGGGAQALMAAFSKAAAAENTGVADPMLGGGLGATTGSHNGGDSLGSAMGDTQGQAARGSGAFSADAASIRSSTPEQPRPPAPAGLGKIGRVAIGTLSNLGQGVFNVAKGHAISLKQTAMHRMESTVGGKIAQAINESYLPAPTGDRSSANKSNSLSAGSRAGVDAAAEVAAFRDRERDS